VGELPGGTVTFLFTDVEGSTRLLQELGGGYAAALAEHRRVLRDAFAQYGGVEVDTQGDAFFVAFARAQDAVAAAAAGQKALATGPLRVRMGLHTGEPFLTDDGYVGLDVHRAARIASAGHGGQVLLSQTTRDLLDPTLELRDLGEHRLKDLTSPERIYQLGHDERPPLKSLNQTNLPIQPSSLIGRHRELGEVLELIRSHRLVTLTGPGGSGKTRLALQSAAEVVDEYADGVWFVSLAALRDPKALLPTVAQTLGIAQPLSIEQQLEHRQTLLLLDNFEQLLEAAPHVGGLLQRAPSLNVLVTSRASLHLSGEREYPVPPLSDADAVALFTERARAVRPAFQANGQVDEICRRVDNLPLAVELAAARTKVLLPQQLLERLDQSLPLLSGGVRDAPERQRTLRATIDWSYELLADQEKQLFRQLAVFAGSFDLEAAEQVCEADLDTLTSLVDKSLLRQTVEGRFFMLATIREYAVERLADDPKADALRRRHAQRVLSVAEHAKALHHEGFDTLQSWHDDARAALDFSIESDEPETALRLAIAFGDFWYVRGHVREGDQRLETVLAHAAEVPSRLRLAGLIRAASLARATGDAARAERTASTALDTARELGDQVAAAAALRELGETMVVRNDYERAFSLYEEALAVARESGDSTVPTLTNLADVALAAGEFERAISYSTEAAALASGPDAESVKAIAAFNSASALIQLGRGNEAPPYLHDALETLVRLDYPELIGWCLIAVAAIALPLQPYEALLLIGTADAAVESAGSALGPAEEQLREWALSRLRERVSAAELDEGLQSGGALALDDAVALASTCLT
jgi:predicted ATPase/class 3 adenylate cyclase